MRRKIAAIPLPLALALLIAIPGIAMAAAAGEKGKPVENESETGPDQGNQVAIEAVTESMVTTETHLTELLGKVPDAAKDGVQRAIQAAREGRERVLAALNRVEETTPSGEAEASAEARGEADVKAGGAQANGTVKARVTIKASTERTQQALKDALAKTDGKARESVRMAMDQVRDGANRALAAIDRVRPERPDVTATAAAAAKGAVRVHADVPRR